jgi:hypothetical protein
MRLYLSIKPTAQSCHFALILIFTKTKLETRSYSEVPSLRVSQFIGRKAILDEIDDTFKETTSTPTVVVSLGMGGQGKTQIALEYCQQLYSGGRFTSVFWVDAMNPNTLDRSFKTLSDTLSNSTRSFADTDSRISFVKTKISCMTQRWLFVFDNFDQPSAFRREGILSPQWKWGYPFHEQAYGIRTSRTNNSGRKYDRR